MKYADAKNVSVIVQSNQKYIIITVTDDGKGFDPAIKRSGIGISNMINRVSSFNGEIEIESAVGSGSKTSIRIPYQ